MRRGSNSRTRGLALSVLLLAGGASAQSGLPDAGAVLAPVFAEVPAAPETPLPAEGVNGAAPGAVVTPVEPSAADVADLDLEALLNTPIVSASKRVQKRSEAPVTISTISFEELEGTGYFSLCDAVQFMPGVDCRRGPMRKAALSIRGLGSNFLSNRVLLLTDGRPETDPWTGIFYPDETTPLLNLKSVEVIRGPSSSLYGTNAFSGVVNVRTRDPKDVFREGRSYGGDARLLGGQDDTLRLTATAAGEAKGVGAMLSYYGYKTDGPELLSDPARGIIDRQQWANVQQIAGKVVHEYVTANAAYTTSNLGRPGGNQFTTVGNCGRCHFTPNDREGVQTFTANVQSEVPLTDHLKVFAEVYTNLKRRAVQLEDRITGELQETVGKRRRIGGEARAMVDGDDFHVQAGFDLKADDVNNNNIFAELTPEELHQTVLGVFADGEYRPHEKVILSAGARYDHVFIPTNIWRTPSSELSPRASAIYRHTNELSFRGAYGHSFRAPSLAELAINQQMYASTVIGNPDLRAERLDAFEASADFRPEGTGARFTATGFANFARDLINPTFIGGSTSQFRNQGSARVLGVEAEVETRMPKNLGTLVAGYRLLDTRAELDDPLTNRLDYAPAHRVSLHAHKKLGDDWVVDAYALYLSGRQDAGLLVDGAGVPTAHVELGSYLLAGGRVGLKVHDKVTTSVLVTNLFNTSYEETFGFPAPGLRFFGEVAFAY